MTSTNGDAARFDVWFDDDGRWRLDERNVTADRARAVIAENLAAGYAAKALAHDADFERTARDAAAATGVL